MRHQNCPDIGGDVYGSAAVGAAKSTVCKENILRRFCADIFPCVPLGAFLHGFKKFMMAVGLGIEVAFFIKVTCPCDAHSKLFGGILTEIIGGSKGVPFSNADFIFPFNGFFLHRIEKNLTVHNFPRADFYHIVSCCHVGRLILGVSDDFVTDTAARTDITFGTEGVDDILFSASRATLCKAGRSIESNDLDILTHTVGIATLRGEAITVVVKVGKLGRIFNITVKYKPSHKYHSYTLFGSNHRQIGVFLQRVLIVVLHRIVSAIDSKGKVGGTDAHGNGAVFILLFFKNGNNFVAKFCVVDKLGYIMNQLCRYTVHGYVPSYKIVIGFIAFYKFKPALHSAVDLGRKDTVLVVFFGKSVKVGFKRCINLVGIDFQLLHMVMVKTVTVVTATFVAILMVPFLAGFVTAVEFIVLFKAEVSAAGFAWAMVTVAAGEVVAREQRVVTHAKVIPTSVADAVVFFIYDDFSAVVANCDA